MTDTPIFKKIIMAISGQVMTLFVIFHLIGNSTIYLGKLNSYAAQLQSLPVIVWASRIIMGALVTVHVIYAIQLALENRAAKPQKYAVNKSLRATFASRNMIWTGLLIGAFIGYHLIQFTFQITAPGIAAGMNPDSLGRPDVARMVGLSFQNATISALYITAMIALFLHLTHGIQSSFQSLGLSNDHAQPIISRSGSIVAIILLIGYAAIPLTIIAGLLNGWS